MVLVLVWQALRGQSVIHPDTATLTAFGALVSLTAISTWVIAVHAKYTNSKARDQAESFPRLTSNKVTARSLLGDLDGRITTKFCPSSTDVFSLAEEKKQ
jgi:hypothetical protein